jgi:hypothetical protein
MPGRPRNDEIEQALNDLLAVSQKGQQGRRVGANNQPVYPQNSNLDPNDLRDAIVGCAVLANWITG